MLSLPMRLREWDIFEIENEVRPVQQFQALKSGDDGVGMRRKAPAANEDAAVGAHEVFTVANSRSTTLCHVNSATIGGVIVVVRSAQETSGIPHAAASNGGRCNSRSLFVQMKASAA